MSFTQIIFNLRPINNSSEKTNMLNYIWLGLLFLGIGTALTLDLSNQTQNKYRNGESVDVSVSFDSSYDKSEKPFDAIIKISAQSFGKFYGENQKEEFSQKVKLTFNKKGNNYTVYLSLMKNLQLYGKRWQKFPVRKMI